MAAVAGAVVLLVANAGTVVAAEDGDAPPGLTSPTGWVAVMTYRTSGDDAAVIPSGETHGGAAPPVVASTDHPLTRLRELYYAAVQDRSAIAPAMEEIESLRSAGMARSGSQRDAVLEAYVGALTTLRAKHGRWPPDRLRHLNNGLEQLDSAVADQPHVVEIRYLRLMSCYYLPGILGRGWSVREDFEVLSRLLPHAAGEYPPELYGAIVRFVLENGELAAAERSALDRALHGAADDTR